MTQPSTSLRPVKPHIVLSKGRAKTTSLVVAKHFGKRHDNVLRDIDRLLTECFAELRRLNFEETSFMSNRGNEAQVGDSTFQMTHDGFSMLALGFTVSINAVTCSAFSGRSAATQPRETS